MRHAKVSAKSDGADTTLVRPSDWNAEHTGGVTFTDAANGDYLARVKKTADTQYRLEAGLRSQGDPQILWGDGTTVDIRLRRNATAQITLDDNAAGPVTQLNVGSLYADEMGGGEYTFKVDHTTGRVTIGGGGSTNLFTVGNQSSTQVQFIVGQNSAYMKGKLATSSSTFVDTQANLAFYAYRWNGAASVEVNGGITYRATATSGTFFFDVPGAEVLVIYGDTSQVEIMGDQGADVGVNLITTGHAERAHYGMDGSRWGGTSATPDTRIRRSTTKTLIADDAAGGALTLFRVQGAFEQTGNLGFYGTAAIAKQTGVAVSAAGIHAALVNLGLISA